jgi:hypothetical protein
VLGPVPANRFDLVPAPDVPRIPPLRIDLARRKHRPRVRSSRCRPPPQPVRWVPNDRGGAGVPAGERRERTQPSTAGCGSSENEVCLKVGATPDVSTSATGHGEPGRRSRVLDRVRAGIPQDQQALGQGLDAAFARPETGVVAGDVREPTQRRCSHPRTSMHRQLRGHLPTSTTSLPARPIERSPDVATLARADPNIPLHPPPAWRPNPEVHDHHVRGVEVRVGRNA